MSRNKIFLVALTLAAALALRVCFIPAPGYERDIQLFKIWSQTAAQHGAHNVYDNTWCDYPPGYLYVLQATGCAYRVFYPDFKEHTYLFDFLIKFPGIAADIIAALLIFFFLFRKYSFRHGFMGMMAYAFNPFVFFNSAYWGQVDSVAFLVIFLAILALVKERYGWSWGLLAAAVLIKTQMVVFLPVIMLVTWRRGGFKKLFGGMAIAWLAAVAILSPFFYLHKVDQVIERLLGAAGAYPYISMNAYNVWWLASMGQGRQVLDTGIFLGLVSYRTLGIMLLGLFFVLLIGYLFSRAKDEEKVWLGCALSAFAFFMLPTEMHERYIFPMFGFLLLASVKDRRLQVVYGLLSISAFLNLFYVLVRTYARNYSSLPPALAAFPADIGISVVHTAALVFFLYLLLRGVKIKYVGIACAAFAALMVGPYLLQPRGAVFLSDLTPARHQQSWGSLKNSRSVERNRLKVNGFYFAKGLGTHAESEIVYNLNGRYRFLEGLVGKDDESRIGALMQFFIMADGRLIYQSPVFRGWESPAYFYLPIAGVRELRLVVKDGGDGINHDHADWLDIKVLP